MLHVGKVLGAAASASFLLIACAGAPRPAEELARAKSLVQQADAANVQRFAAVELNQARDKLQEAQRADTEEKNDVARRRANEASADAELATALARSREAERAVQEQQKSIDQLRREAMQGVPATPPNE